MYHLPGVSVRCFPVKLGCLETLFGLTITTTKRITNKSFQACLSLHYVMHTNKPHASHTDHTLPVWWFLWCVSDAACSPGMQTLIVVCFLNENVILKLLRIMVCRCCLSVCRRLELKLKDVTLVCRTEIIVIKIESNWKRTDFGQFIDCIFKMAQHLHTVISGGLGFTLWPSFFELEVDTRWV